MLLLPLFCTLSGEIAAAELGRNKDLEIGEIISSTWSDDVNGRDNGGSSDVVVEDDTDTGAV